MVKNIVKAEEQSKKCLNIWLLDNLIVILQPQIVALVSIRVSLIKNLKQKDKMIIVPVKEGENIEKALKKFKRKFEKTGVIKELRARQQFDKPSVLKRLKMEHAVYVQKMRNTEE